MDSPTTIPTNVTQYFRTAEPTAGKQRQTFAAQSRQIPKTTIVRQQASLNDLPIDIPQTLQHASNGNPDQSDTVLYLGYGSNLSAETFLGKRQIKPLSQVNVVVPEIRLTFDLPGLPYTEPCFGNCAYRSPPPTPPNDSPIQEKGYHKDAWRKGLVGVAYEVTKADFAHIIATEGGGSGYQDVLVDCYALSDNPRDLVPEHPSSTNNTTLSSFKAHTLFAPVSIDRPHGASYAQPSARYLKLITDGAAEHALPYEYQDYLHQIHSYQLTTTKQRLGQFVFLSLWVPVFAIVFQGGGRIFLRPDGTYPAWFANFARVIFQTCWASYDGFFEELFGDGERTIGDDPEKDGGGGGGGGGKHGNEKLDNRSRGGGEFDEKAPLIRESIRRYGIGGRIDNMV